jgi:hypothetical protein
MVATTNSEIVIVEKTTATTATTIDKAADAAEELEEVPKSNNDKIEEEDANEEQEGQEEEEEEEEISKDNKIICRRQSLFNITSIRKKLIGVSTDNIIKAPNEHDVLLGRGKPVSCYYNNTVHTVKAVKL